MPAGGEKSRPWWWSPGPIVFGAVILIGCVVVLFEDKIIHPKPVDVRDKVTLSGGATFCDPVPLPPNQRVEGSAVTPSR